jgi:serine/threonine protein kinase
MQLPQEALLGDRWQLLSPIGEGAMGEVWHGRHAQLGHDVAIKLMKQEAAQDQNLVARFRREARIAAQLRSKYIVRVEDYGTSRDGRPYLVMEFLRGQTLAAVLERTPRPDRAFVARVVQHIAAACDVAHPAGIVHRDLKPENCFVVQDDDGAALVKVLDFGVAKITDNVFVTQNGVVTGSHALLGTPVYMSPEQARGEPNLDGRSDLWSLSVIAYEMLTGRIPFDVGSLAQVLYAVLAGPIAPPSTLDATIPRAVDGWAARALNRDRAQRFSSGRELSAALAQALGLARVTPSSVPWAANAGPVAIDRTHVATGADQHASGSYAPYTPTHSDAHRPIAMSQAPLHMPSAAPAPNEALTWSGAGGGAPLVQPAFSTSMTPPVPLPAVVVPAPHASHYPSAYATQAQPYAPAVNRRRLHGMGFVFLAVGALSAAALGSVVRARRAAAREPATSAFVQEQPAAIGNRGNGNGVATSTEQRPAQQIAPRVTQPLPSQPPTSQPGSSHTARPQVAHTNSSAVAAHANANVNPDAHAARSAGATGTTGVGAAAQQAAGTTPRANPQGERSFDSL